MLNFVNTYGHNWYSQNGEDGIIQECLHRMGITKGKCAEFGAADGKFCSNTFKLLEQEWEGIMIESDKSLYDKLTENVKNLSCACVNDFVTPANVNKLIPADVDVLSIDTDGSNDYESWMAYNGRPKIVIIEINSSKDPFQDYLGEGASYRTMVKLGLMKGYFLLCHTGNLIFVKQDYKHLFPGLIDDPIIDVDKYFNTQWINQAKYM